jgi:hypothetical protein
MITIQRYYQYIPRLHRLSNIVCITITIPVFYLNENTSIITIGLPYLQSKKKRKGIYHYSTVWVILLLSYCLASFWGFTFWMKRSRSTFLAPASPRGETATWYLQSSRLRSGILFKLKPSKRMVGQIDSVPYLFLFLFLAHVQKMVYQSITYIIVPVPAHCTPTFYGIMDTMCVRVCVCVSAPATFMYVWQACMCRSADVSTFGDFHISLLALILLRPSKCGTIRKYYHWLWALITVYLILPISSNVLPWHMDHDLALHISHIWFIKRVDEATEISIFHK